MRKILTLIFAAACMTVAAYAQNQQIRIFAHRGGRMEYDENTISAFEQSYQKGFRGYETDIRLTKDGVPVILHDSDLKRTTDTEGRVEEMTAAQIRKANTKEGHKVMFLDELMTWIKEKGDIEYVEFEIKSNPEELYPLPRMQELCEKVWKMAIKDKPEGVTYLVTSFDYRALRYLQQAHPETEMLVITGKPCNDETIALCKALGINRLGAKLDGTSREAIKKAHEKGVIVSLWPNKSVEDMLLSIYLGADFACTDIPVKTKNYLENNTPWINTEY